MKTKQALVKQSVEISERANKILGALPKSYLDETSSYIKGYYDGQLDLLHRLRIIRRKK